MAGRNFDGSSGRARRVLTATRTGTGLLILPGALISYRRSRFFPFSENLMKRYDLAGCAFASVSSRDNTTTTLYGHCERPLVEYSVHETVSRRRARREGKNLRKELRRRRRHVRKTILQIVFVNGPTHVELDEKSRVRFRSNTKLVKNVDQTNVRCGKT